MVPVGRGQRELIIGDRQTGKTAVARLTPSSIKRSRRFTCIYVAIGQKASSVKTWCALEAHGAMEYTIVVAATASESAAMQYVSRTLVAQWANTSVIVAKTL